MRGCGSTCTPSLSGTCAKSLDKTLRLDFKALPDGMKAPHAAGPLVKSSRGVKGPVRAWHGKLDGQTQWERAESGLAALMPTSQKIEIWGTRVPQCSGGGRRSIPLLGFHVTAMG